MSPEENSARAVAVGKKDKIVVEKDEVEQELIPGWTKEVRIRKAGSATKVDRYYTDPVTGYIFHSLRDVQRYLKTGEVGRLATKPKVEEREKPSELKEQVTETLSNKRAQPDNSELSARASKRQAGVNSDAQSPPQPKTRQATQLAGTKVDAPSPLQSPPEPKTRQATRLAGVEVDAPPLPSDRKPRQPTRLVDVAAESSPSSPPEPKTRQATRLAGVTVDASVPSPPPSAVPKTRQAARQAGIKIDSPPPLPPDSKTHQAAPPDSPTQPEPKTRQAKRASGIRDDASPISPPLPKTRRAIQQAGIKVNSPPPSPPDTRNSRQATRTRPVNSATQKQNDKKIEVEKTTDKHDENADMDANTNNNQENLVITSPLNQESNILPPKEHNKHIEKPPEAQQPPTVVPPLNSEKQEFPVVNPTVSNPVPQASYNYGTDMKPDSSINFSMNDLWTDPCIEFAVKTLTGAIPVTDLNKVENSTAPTEVPLEDIWTDPCIEFAVKTLTGAIPVGEDDYLLHRPSSSTNPIQGPHNFSSPMNVSQTGHKNTQQESVFPKHGNGGFQKSGKFVNGSNAQCSRSWFFQ